MELKRIVRGHGIENRVSGTAVFLRQKRNRIPASIPDCRNGDFSSVYFPLPQQQQHHQTGERIFSCRENPVLYYAFSPGRKRHCNAAR